MANENEFESEKADRVNDPSTISSRLMEDVSKMSLQSFKDSFSSDKFPSGDNKLPALAIESNQKNVVESLSDTNGKSGGIEKSQGGSKVESIADNSDRRTSDKSATANVVGAVADAVGRLNTVASDKSRTAITSAGAVADTVGRLNNSEASDKSRTAMNSVGAAADAIGRLNAVASDRSRTAVNSVGAAADAIGRLNAVASDKSRTAVNADTAGRLNNSEVSDKSRTLSSSSADASGRINSFDASGKSRTANGVDTIADTKQNATDATGKRQIGEKLPNGINLPGQGLEEPTVRWGKENISGRHVNRTQEDTPNQLDNRAKETLRNDRLDGPNQLDNRAKETTGITRPEVNPNQFSTLARELQDPSLVQWINRIKELANKLSETPRAKKNP